MKWNYIHKITQQVRDGNNSRMQVSSFLSQHFKSHLHDQPWRIIWREPNTYCMLYFRTCYIWDLIGVAQYLRWHCAWLRAHNSNFKIILRSYHVWLAWHLYQVKFRKLKNEFIFCPGGASGKESACQCRRRNTQVWSLSRKGNDPQSWERNDGNDPQVEKKRSLSPWRRKW